MKLTHALCAAVMFAGSSSRAHPGEYVVGTKKNGDALKAAAEKKAAEQQAKEEADTVSANIDGSYGIFLLAERMAGPHIALDARRVVSELETTTSAVGQESLSPSEPMSTETLDELGPAGANVLHTRIDHIRRMEENSWLESFKNDEALPLGRRIKFVHPCDVLMYQARATETKTEVPGAESKSWGQFAESHISYSQEVPEHVVPARWCTKDPAAETESCAIAINAISYKDVLRLAKEWETAHPDDTIPWGINYLRVCPLSKEKVPAPESTPAPTPPASDTFPFSGGSLRKEY